MKKRNIITLLAAAAVAFSACGSPSEEAQSPPAAEEAGETAVSTVGEGAENDASHDGHDHEGIYRSAILDENGFFAGVITTDYFDLFEYRGLQVPQSAHYVSDEEVQAEVDAIIEWFQIVERIYDRPVEDGDVVNIDFVGSIDGVEFEGGSSGGTGYSVTAGSEDFIDDFLFQIIGAMPGSTLNVEVSFPEDYPETSLAGKPALFVTTINYIHGETQLRDADVAEHLYESFGWMTVEETYAGLRENMQKSAISDFVMSYVTEHIENNIDAAMLPAALLEHYDLMLTEQVESGAESQEIELSEYLAENLKVETMEEFLELNRDSHVQEIAFFMMMQGIAEDAGISVSPDDLPEYFFNVTGSSDYSMYEHLYGLPYLVQSVLAQNVLDYIAANAVLEDA